ncbi:MAG: SLC13 family permease [Saprospiraceae bacterium]
MKSIRFKDFCQKASNSDIWFSDKRQGFSIYGFTQGWPDYGASTISDYCIITYASWHAQEAQFTAGITLWIAAWWILEPVNSAVTSLLPIVLFPLCGVMSLKSLSGEYANQIIFLFMAGFFLGKTIEKWELHRRIALNMVSWMGSNPSGMVLRFMTATAVISMWISNTATAVMMTPVAIAVSKNAMRQEGMNENFSKTLMLGVGYACSIGGLATIIGTPTNAIFWDLLAELGATISFWNGFGRIPDNCGAAYSLLDNVG